MDDVTNLGDLKKKICKINLLNSGRRSVEQQFYWGTKTEYFAENFEVCIFTTGKRTLHRIITILPKTTQKETIFSLYEFIAFRFRVVNFFPPAFFRCVKIDVLYKTCDQLGERSKPLDQSDVKVKPIQLVT